MKAPLASENGQSAAAALANPAVLVILIIIFGATVYLFRQRYIEPRTAYVVMIIVAIVTIWVGMMIYTS